MSDYELYHYGVKGMKWGVRRYQNADGTLTALGKRRASSKDIRAYRKQAWDDVEAESKARYGKELKDLEKQAKSDYDAFVKKHKLLEDFSEGFEEDYEDRHMLYDQRDRAYDKLNKRRREIDAIESKEVTKRLVDRYGQERIDKFNKSEQVKAGMQVTATLAGMGALFTLPFSAVGAGVVGIGIAGLGTATTLHEAMKKPRQ